MIKNNDNLCGKCGKPEFGCDGVCGECEKCLRDELAYSQNYDGFITAAVPRYLNVYDPLTNQYKPAYFIRGEPKYVQPPQMPVD